MTALEVFLIAIVVTQNVMLLVVHVVDTRAEHDTFAEQLEASIRMRRSP